uniref:NAD(P)(+)--arginine ADP-ribosyltransferase n=1 Tax=Lates calcarifer TaxID=8187 RepID=A0A4W6C9H6_LATCA
MAPHAVDVLYDKCRKEAIKEFIHSGVLKAELKGSEGFQKAWSASTQCSEMIPGGIKEHTTALLAYAYGDPRFKKTFNDKVETMGANVSSYVKDFHFKSLHFLLMDYMMLQKPKNCTTVYVIPRARGTTLKSIEVELDGDIILNITSCLFILLSPVEEFIVESVNRKVVDDTEHTEIVLKHSGLRSSDRCHIFSRYKERSYSFSDSM